jgi:hypothetical protein
MSLKLSWIAVSEARASAHQGSLWPDSTDFVLCISRQLFGYTGRAANAAANAAHDPKGHCTLSRSLGWFAFRE